MWRMGVCLFRERARALPRPLACFTKDAFNSPVRAPGAGWRGGDGQGQHARTPAREKLVLCDEDVEEKFVKGKGPGGQKINKVRNRVQLMHLPTGVTASCQDSRELAKNRAIARKLLREKVEVHLRGRDSTVGRRIDRERRRKAKQRQRANKKKEKMEMEMAKGRQPRDESGPAS